MYVTLQDEQGGVVVKGLTVRVANNEEEALNMLFEVRHCALTVLVTLQCTCTEVFCLWYSVSFCLHIHLPIVPVRLL